MGTIGDSLGVDLMALFGAGEDQAQPELSPDADGANQPARDVPSASGPDGVTRDSLNEEGRVDSGHELIADGVAEEFVQTAADGPEAVLRGIASELTGVPGHELDLDSPLDGTLNLTGLALWAVVAEMERGLGLVFPDSQVEEWKTLRDVLDAS